MHRVIKSISNAMGTAIKRQFSSTKLPKVSHLPANKDLGPSLGTTFNFNGLSAQKETLKIEGSSNLQDVSNLKDEYPDIYSALKNISGITSDKKTIFIGTAWSLILNFLR